MSQIPAPVLNRHTAIAVVVFSLLGVAASVATLVVPIDGSVFWLVLVRQLVLTAQVVVVALAVFLIWRTVAGRSFGTTLAALAAIGGLLLFALVHLATIVVATPWGVRPVVIGLELVALLAALLFVPGLIALGVSVQRHSAWQGPTSATLAVIALLAIVLGVAQVMHLAVAVPYGFWSLSFLGLAVGLRTRRTVPVSGVPDSQLGAARV